MIGVIGKIVVDYQWKNKSYQEEFDISNAQHFSLKYISDCVFVIDEVDYIEDTIYGVDININDEEIYLSGNAIAKFKLPLHDINGTMRLIVK